MAGGFGLGGKRWVIGGGDTGNDCRWARHPPRLRERYLQLEMMPACPPPSYCKQPWPEWPRVLKTDYG